MEKMRQSILEGINLNRQAPPPLLPPPPFVSSMAPPFYPVPLYPRSIGSVHPPVPGRTRGFTGERQYFQLYLLRTTPPMNSYEFVPLLRGQVVCFLFFLSLPTQQNQEAVTSCFSCSPHEIEDTAFKFRPSLHKEQVG